MKCNERLKIICYNIQQTKSYAQHVAENKADEGSD